MNVPWGSPALISATMPWGPIIAPALKASPSLRMEEPVKVFIHNPETNGHISAKVMTITTWRECGRPTLFYSFDPSAPLLTHTHTLGNRQEDLNIAHTLPSYGTLHMGACSDPLTPHITMRRGIRTVTLVILQLELKEVAIKNLSKLHNLDSTLGTLTTTEKTFFYQTLDMLQSYNCVRIQFYN